MKTSSNYKELFFVLILIFIFALFIFGQAKAWHIHLSEIETAEFSVSRKNIILIQKKQEIKQLFSELRKQDFRIDFARMWDKGVVYSVQVKVYLKNGNKKELNYKVRRIEKFLKAAGILIDETGILPTPLPIRK